MSFVLCCLLTLVGDGSQCCSCEEVRCVYEACALLLTLVGDDFLCCSCEEVRCRCEDQIVAGQDEISQLTAKQAVAEKALEVGAAQVAQLKQTLGEQSLRLSSTEVALSLLKASSKWM